MDWHDRSRWPYIVAEMSCNHGGSLDRAVEMIRAANKCGADAVKFQAYEPDCMTIDCDRDDFILKEGPWKGRKLWDLYKEAQTPLDWFPVLAQVAWDNDISWFASVFDKRSVDVVAGLDTAAFKIASFEITDLPLIRYAATKGHIIISTGMAGEDEIQDAADAAHEARVYPVFLACTSAYPAKAEDGTLARLAYLNGRYRRCGISDHTLGRDIAAAATAMGASIIEKHFTLDRGMGGPDAAFSMEPAEFAGMVKAVRAVKKSMESGAGAGEAPQRQARRSLYCVKDIAEGEIITAEHVRSIRPGYGLAPKEIEKVIGREAERDIVRGEAIEWNMLRVAHGAGRGDAGDFSDA